MVTPATSMFNNTQSRILLIMMIFSACLLQPTAASYGYGGNNGDWDCPACGAVGCFGSKPNCFKCGAPNPSSAKPNRRPGDWDCPSCGAMVFGSKSECFKCGEPKPNNSRRRLFGNKHLMERLVRLEASD